MAEYISKDYLLSALSVFSDVVNGNPHFLNGIETAREIVEDAPIFYAGDGERCCYDLIIDVNNKKSSLRKEVEELRKKCGYAMEDEKCLSRE